MSKIKGMEITCERCKKKVFVKRLDDTVMDGGYTRAERYEDTPDGWGTFYYKNKSMDMCPDCLAYMENVVEKGLNSIEMNAEDIALEFSR